MMAILNTKQNKILLLLLSPIKKKTGHSRVQCYSSYEKCFIRESVFYDELSKKRLNKQNREYLSKSSSENQKNSDLMQTETIIIRSIKKKD